jgi:hypothetical protein
MHGKLKNTPSRPVTVILVILAVIVGYGAMWLSGYYLNNDNMVVSVLLQLAMIGMVFGITYAILKGVFHNQRLKDPHERELRLKDLPKDAPEPRIRHE